MWNVKAKVMPVIIRATGRISKSPEQHKRKTRNKGTTKKNHIRHCILTSKSANVKVQNIFRG